MKRFSILGAVAMSAAALTLGTVGADAKGPPTGKCSSAKIKCATTKTTALLSCHNKAETKDLAVDPACISKADMKFSLPATGCMEKAEKDLVKSPCSTTGDATSLEAKVDAFVLDAVTELDPGYPTPVLNKCSAGKKKCVANQVKAILGCYGKAASAGGSSLPPVVPPPPNVEPTSFQECITKARDKFDPIPPLDPSKGCFAKLEAKPPCLTTGDAAALETKVEAFSLDVYAQLVPHLDFTLRPAGGICGNVKDQSSTVIKSLTCGGLNIGGGSSIIVEGPTPDGSTSRFTLACPDAGECTLGPTTRASTTLAGATVDCTNTGCNFGTPLEIPNHTTPALTTCVLNTWGAPTSGTVNVADGTSVTNVPLISDTYLTANDVQPCPRCRSGGSPVSGSPSSPATGTCDRGPRKNMACTSQNSVGLTNDCLTGGTDPTHPCGIGGSGPCLDGSHNGPLVVNLTAPLGALTTGTVNNITAAGLFCSGQPNVGCFGQLTCRSITETGTPAGPVAVGVPANATLASVFCIPTSGNGLVDLAASLPGPGALTLPGTFVASQ